MVKIASGWGGWGGHDGGFALRAVLVAGARGPAQAEQIVNIWASAEENRISRGIEAHRTPRAQEIQSLPRGVPSAPVGRNFPFR